MTENEGKLLKNIVELVQSMQEIQFICERAKRHYIEPKDIEDILEITKKVFRGNRDEKN